MEYRIKHMNGQDVTKSVDDGSMGFKIFTDLSIAKLAAEKLKADTGENFQIEGRAIYYTTQTIDEALKAS